MDNAPERIFKIGTVRIAEDDSTRNMSIEEVRNMLKGQYPEVSAAKHSERKAEDGKLIIEFAAQPGRRG